MHRFPEKHVTPLVRMQHPKLESQRASQEACIASMLHSNLCIVSKGPASRNQSKGAAVNSDSERRPMTLSHMLLDQTAVWTVGVDEPGTF